MRPRAHLLGPGPLLSLSPFPRSPPLTFSPGLTEAQDRRAVGTLIFAGLDMEHTLYGAARPLARPCRPGTPVVRVESPTSLPGISGRRGFAPLPSASQALQTPAPPPTAAHHRLAPARPRSSPRRAANRESAHDAARGDGAPLPRAPPLSQRSLHCYHHRLVSGIAGRLGGWLRTEGNNDIGRAPQDAHVQIGVPDGQVSLS